MEIEGLVVLVVQVDLEDMEMEVLVVVAD